MSYDVPSPEVEGANKEEHNPAETSSSGKPEDDGSTQGVQDPDGAPADNPSGG